MIQKIKERIKEYKKLIDEESFDSIDLKIGKRNACTHILNFLDTLREEEVDLEKEIKETCRGYRITDSYESSLGKNDIRNIATHFYNLGKQSSDKDCPKIKVWVARHRDGELCLFREKPEYKIHLGWDDEHQHWWVINPHLFPDLKMKSSPIEVELTVKKI